MKEASSLAIAGIDSDSVSSDAVDHLGVEREAHAFARVAASHSVVPPLSIGVFGEWGSGKTFFMEKMRTRVERLSRSAAAARRKDEATAYHESIVQIRFNAWHYMETNLWASLVDHIFRELDNWLRREEPDPEKIQALYERLSTARTLKLDAAESLVEAGRRQQDAEAQVERARQELAAETAGRGSVKMGEFWGAVGETLFSQVSDSAEKEKLGKALDAEKEELQEAARTLGFVAAADSARGLMEALATARDQTGRGRQLLRSVATRLGSGWWLALLVGLLVLFPLSVPFLASGRLAAFFDEVGTAAWTFASMAAVLAAWLGDAVRAGAGALSRLSDFQDRLDEKLKLRDTPQPILQAEQLLAQRRQEVELAEAHLEATTGALQQARSAFEDTALVRLNRFIRDKIVNGDYAKHLGIIASIRKDFEELAEIMVGVDRERPLIDENEEERRVYALKLGEQLDSLVACGLLTKEERRDLEPGEASGDGKLSSFQRIILYIDDLDRCPPQKVVEVLQACHLLLHFPLFIVVVAVDARWVSRALLDQYEGLLDGGPPEGEEAVARGAAADSDGTASPRDYLEKIFQIPYWVRRMHGDASRDYALELIGAVAGEAAAEDEDVEPLPAEGQVESAEAVDATPDDEAPADEVPDDEAAEEEIDDEAAGLAGEGHEEAGGDGVGEDEAEEIDPNPESLLLTSHERNFLARLAPHAGRSPRTIKRFVNVYRVLRTGLPEDVLQELVGEEGASLTYRAIIAQLAIVTGAPTLADAYFAELGPPGTDEGAPSDLRGLLESAADVRDSPEWPTVAGALAELAKVENTAQMLHEMRLRASVVKRYSFSARSYL